MRLRICGAYLQFPHTFHGVVVGVPYLIVSMPLRLCSLAEDPYRHTDTYRVCTFVLYFHLDSLTPLMCAVRVGVA
jgi:hypothetical protein